MEKEGMKLDSSGLFTFTNPVGEDGLGIYDKYKSTG
jgi:hypothetical protein